MPTDFFSLPRELRDHIYELALCSKEPSCTFETTAVDNVNNPEYPAVQIDRKYACALSYQSDRYSMFCVIFDCPLLHHDYTYRTPALLATCRQTRAEARDIYYAKTHFVFEDIDRAIVFALSLEDRDFKMVKSLRCCLCAADVGEDAITKEKAEDLWEKWAGMFKKCGLDVSGKLFVCRKAWPPGAPHWWVGKGR